MTDGKDGHRSTGHEGLAHRRVLVVEDEAAVALDLKYTLQAAGCTVVGPLARLDDALRTAAEEPIDLALLDIGVGGEPVFPVADRLAARAIPFVFLTGYDRSILPLHLQERPICRKPHSPRHLLVVLKTALSR